MQRTLALLGIVACMTVSMQAQLTVGLKEADSSASFGYTLIAPLTSTSTYLIDHCGRAVHSWQSEYVPGFAAHLCPNGDLLRTLLLMNSPLLNGSGGGIERRSWDGDLLWSYAISDSTRLMHHDVKLMPNGNILVLVSELIAKADAWAAGRDSTRLLANFWVDAVYEIKPIGTNDAEIVWKWRVWDHLIQDRNPALPSYGVVSDNPGRIDINYATTAPGVLYRDFTHFNYVDYNPETDEILISVRNFNEVWIVDHSTSIEQAAGTTGGLRNSGGDLLYRWGNPMAYGRGTIEDQALFAQHNAHWIPAGRPYAGHIMVFNNGVQRPVRQIATVDVFLPSMNSNGTYALSEEGRYSPQSAIYSYGGDGDTTLNSMFYSSAQFLASGNLRVTQGMTGTITEVNPAHEIVWEYVNPVNANGPIAQGANPGNNGVFSSTLYPRTYAGFDSRDLTHGDPIEIDPVDIGCTLSNNTTGVSNEVRDLRGISFAPNPCDQQGTLRLVVAAQHATVINSLGQPVLAIQLEGLHQSIDVSSLPPGAYTLLVDNGSSLQLVKLK